MNQQSIEGNLERVLRESEGNRAHYRHSSHDYSQLTEVERKILRLMSEGNSNKMLAAAHICSEETIKTHVRNILGKLKANDRTHAVAIGFRRGIIPIDS